MDVKNNAARKRFEIEADGQTAFLEYAQRPGDIELIHTEVPPALEGRGIGSALAQAGLNYAREHALKVTPQCTFVQGYLKRHPEYNDLISPA